MYQIRQWASGIEMKLMRQSGLQAYAAARMAESCLLGLQGKDNIYECAYVESSLIPELSYFASKVRTPQMRW